MSEIDRRQVLRLLAALGTTGLAAACGTSAGPDDAADNEPVSGDPVRIGLVAPQSGGYKDIGEDLQNGFQLFLDLNNNRLGGHPVELVTADEGDTAQTGKAAVDSLLKQGVNALTGVVSSSVMLSIRDTVEQAKVPLVGSNASPLSLQSVVYIWRTSYVNDEPGKALAPYVATKVQKKGTVVTISPQTPGGADAVNGFRQAFGPTDHRLASTPIWTDVTINPSADTYAGPIQKVMSLNPDAIFCFFAGAAAVQFIKQLRAAGYRNTLYGSGFLTEGTVLSQLKPAEAQGIVTALNYSSDLNNAANRQFASAYRKAHSEAPTTYAMASYDAAQVLDKAIRITTKDPTPQNINLALGRVGQIDSPRGPWQFNQSRTPQQNWYLRRVQRDGQTLANVLIDELGTLG